MSCGSRLAGTSFHAGGGGAPLEDLLTFPFHLPSWWLVEAELLDDELVALVGFFFFLSAVLGCSSSLSVQCSIHTHCRPAAFVPYLSSLGELEA